MSGRTRRPDLRRPPQSTARPLNIHRVSMPGSRAGPSRRRGPGPLPTPSTSWRVTGPWWVVKSLRSVTSYAPNTTALSMVFRSVGPGRHWATVGHRSSHHRDAGWNCATSVTGPGRPAGRISLRSLRHRRGGSFRSLRWVLLPSDAPWVVTSLRSTMAISATMLMTVWTMVIWMKSLAGLLHMEYGKLVIRSLRRLGLGGCFRYSGCSLWSLTGRAKCWHQKTWMNPILQLECSLLGYPGQLAHHPLPAISTSWSVAFWPVGAGPSHHRHTGSHGLLKLTGPGRPDGRLLHFRSLRPRTCGCLGSLGLGWPVTRTLGRKLKDLFRSMYLNWAVHCPVLMVCWVDHTSRVVIIMCWLVTRRVDPSSFAESGTWAALPCQVVILLGPSHCEDDPSRVAEPCDQDSAPIEDQSCGSAILLCWQAVNDFSHKSE